MKELGGATTFEACHCPLAVTAWNVGRLRTEVLSGPAGSGGSGGSDLASAVAASVSVPGLFAPAAVGGRWPLVDGALGDPTGLAGCPALPPHSGRILHLGFPGAVPGWRGVGAPAHLPAAALEQQAGAAPGHGPARVEMLSLVLEGSPGVGPFNMESVGA